MGSLRFTLEETFIPDTLTLTNSTPVIPPREEATLLPGRFFPLWTRVRTYVLLTLLPPSLVPLRSVRALTVSTGRRYPSLLSPDLVFFGWIGCRVRVWTGGLDTLLCKDNKFDESHCETMSSGVFDYVSPVIVTRECLVLCPCLSNIRILSLGPVPQTPVWRPPSVLGRYTKGPRLWRPSLWSILRRSYSGLCSRPLPDPPSHLPFLTSRD